MNSPFKRPNVEVQTPVANVKRQKGDSSLFMTPSPVKASIDTPKRATAKKNSPISLLRSFRKGEVIQLKSTLLSFNDNECEQQLEREQADATEANTGDENSVKEVLKIFEIVDLNHKRESFRVQKQDETVREFLGRVIKLADEILDTIALRGENGVIVYSSEKMWGLDDSMSFTVFVPPTKRENETRIIRRTKRSNGL